MGRSLVASQVVVLLDFSSYFYQCFHTQMKNGAWYILFRGFSNPFVYHENADLGTLSKGITLSATSS